MKNAIIILFYFIIPAITYGQFDPDTCSQSYYYSSIKTPTNVTVEAIVLSEFSPDCLSYLEDVAADWIDDHNSNALRSGPASGTYNCHAYAFHIKDGGNAIWLNAHDDHDNDPEILKKYWSGTSPTYTQTASASKATIAFYGSCWQYSNGEWKNNCDHSAEVISPNLFESKWGAWPRYRHAPGDTPYNSSNIEYYYIPITGDNLICTSEGYSTLSISGASYDWSGSKISISGSGSSVTATKTGNGQGWIQADISSPYSGTEVTAEQQDFWLGNPGDLPVQIQVILGGPSDDELCVEQNMRVATGYPNYAFHGVTEFTWNFGSWASYLQGYDISSPDKQIPIFNVPYSAQGMQTLYVNAVNACGNSPQQSRTIDAIDCSGLLKNNFTIKDGIYSKSNRINAGVDIFVFPNPSSNTEVLAEVVLDENAFHFLNSSHNDIKQINTELRNITGKVIARKSMKVVKGTQIYQIQFDVGHLSTGMYILRAYNESGTISIAKKVVIE